tara:strand:- start:5752 stop:6342 length:591 start_codon:yes stop_codon:yes gene_type:complete
MEIREINIDEIKPYKNNPREISNEAVEKVVKSIKVFGYNQPIVVDNDNVIVVGHTRWKALKKLGKEKVFIIKKNFTKNNAVAYRIMDNRANEESKWQNKLLKEELNLLQDENFDLDLTGFDETELDQFFLPKDEDNKIGDIDLDIAQNDVKMIQIFFNPEQETSFKRAIEKLYEKYKVDNISDAVLQAVVNESNNS